ncbi:hypothetical protein BC831DRAFT_443330 [Entophlyctis helioformis]|nr:hypothetical protein BC831DRAFT_443330 [Entophlyctis helioformis]
MSCSRRLVAQLARSLGASPALAAPAMPCAHTPMYTLAASCLALAASPSRRIQGRNSSSASQPGDGGNRSKPAATKTGRSRRKVMLMLPPASDHADSNDDSNAGLNQFIRSRRQRQDDSQYSAPKQRSLEVREPDLDGFFAAIESQDRVPAWLKFRDIAYDANARASLTTTHLVDLMKLLGKHKPPLFSSMREMGMPRTLDMYTTLMRAHGRMGDMDGATRVLADLKAAGLPVTIAIHNEFIRIAAKQVNLATAERMAEDVVGQGISLDADTYTTLVSACVDAGLFDKAQMYLDRSDLRRQQGNLEAARKAWLDMQDLRAEPDRALCSVFIDGFSSTGDVATAQQVVQWMTANGVVPEPGAFLPLVKALATTGDVHGAMKFISTMETLQGRLDMSLYYGIINGACQAGHIDDALDIVEGLKSRSVRPPLTMLRSIFAGLVEAKRANEAYALFDEIQADGYEVSLDVYNVMLKAASQLHDLDMIRNIWKLMRMNDKRITPDAAAYMTTFKAYVAAHDVEAAFKMCEEMIASSFEPDVNSLLLLIHACVVWMRRSHAARDADLRAVMEQYRKEFEDLIFALAKESQAAAAAAAAEAQSSETVQLDGRGRAILVAAPAEQNQAIGDAGKRNSLIIDLYKELVNAGITPSEKALQEVMRVHCQLRDLVGVVKVWTTLHKSYPQPSAESVTVLLNATSELGLQKTAQAVKTMVEKESLPLNADGHEALIVMYARCGMSELVIHAMVDMVEAGFPLTTALYRRVKHAVDQQRPRKPAVRKAIQDFVEEQFPEIVTEDESIEMADQKFRLSLIP